MLPAEIDAIDIDASKGPLSMPPRAAIQAASGVAAFFGAFSAGDQTAVPMLSTGRQAAAVTSKRFSDVVALTTSRELGGLRSVR